MRNKKTIYLVHPPLFERSYPGKAMGLDYIAGYLQDNGYKVRIMDVEIIGFDTYLEEIKNDKPDIIGITNLSIQNDDANFIAKITKEILPGSVIVKGGWHERFSYKITLQLHHDYVDFCAIGEGEELMFALCNSYYGGNLKEKKYNIRGLAFWENGEVVVSKTLSRNKNIDNFLPYRQYYHSNYNFDIFNYKKTAQIMSVRGCESNCTFCSESRMGNLEIQQSLYSLEKQLIELKKDGYEAIYFDDSTFTRDKNRTFEVTALLKKYNFIWGCNTRVDTLDEKIISNMSNSGCVYCFCGIESNSEEVLKGFGKTNDPVRYKQKAIEVYELFRKYNLPISAFLVFGGLKYNKVNGHSVESFDDIKDTLNFAINELNPDFISMNILRILPGLPIAFSPIYKPIRPMGKKIHGGFYDTKWYMINKTNDLRTTHDIYRAFEGKNSIAPPHMSPQFAYEILKHALDQVNQINFLRRKNNVKMLNLVVSKYFFNKYMTRNNGQYSIADFELIEDKKSPKLSDTFAEY